MRYLTRFTGLVTAVGLLMLAPVVSASAQPSLYFAQADVAGAAKTNVSLPVSVNAAGVPLDAVQLNVAFPADKLLFVGLNESGSSFNAFIPAAPTAVNGRLSFGAASLSKQAVTGNELVVKLIFRVKASAGVAAVSLAGSQAYRDGALISNLGLSGATVHASPTSDTASTSSTDLGLSSLAVSDITVNNATVHWRTKVPASSLVDFGQSKFYGLTAGSDALVTNHVVKLGAVLPGSTNIHFKLSSVTANGGLQSSADQTFMTKGYTVAIKVTNRAGRPVSGATVQIAGGQKVRANEIGVATLYGVAVGSQQVTINGGQAQNIIVKHAVGTQAAMVQQFTLRALPRQMTLWYLAVGALVLLALLFVLDQRLHPGATKNTDVWARKFR